MIGTPLSSVRARLAADGLACRVPESDVVKHAALTEEAAEEVARQQGRGGLLRRSH